MNNLVRKFALLILVLLLSILLTACTNGSIEEGRLEYSASRIIPPSEVGVSLAAAKYEDTIWALFYRNTEITSFNREGQALLTMHIEEPENICGFTMSSDGTMILVAKNDNVLHVQRIANDGTVLSTTQVNIEIDGASSSVECISVIAESSGDFYIAWRSAGTNGITCLSEDGTTLFTLSTKEVIYSIALSGDSIIALLDGNQLRMIDKKNMTWSSPIGLKGLYRNIFSGDNETVYLDDGQSLIEFDYSTSILTRLFYWSTLGISSPAWVVKYNSLFVAYSFQDGIHLIETKESSGSEEDNRKVITLAASEVDRIRKEIVEFNTSNTEYCIEVEEFNESTIDRLLTLMSSGNVPDIIFFTKGDLFTKTFSTAALGAKGFLADISEYIDSDPELEQTDFQNNIFTAAMEGERLYELPFSFWIDVIAGDVEVLGSEPGWTFEDLQTTIKSIGFEGYPLGPELSREIVLELMLFFNMDEYVDWETGTCSFSSKSFQNMLKFLEKYTPATAEALSGSEQKLIADRRQLLVRQTVGTSNYLQVFDFFFAEPVLKGFPTSFGCGNAIVFDGSFSISSSTKYSDGVWSFVRQFYTYDYYLSHNSFYIFPINSEALEHSYQKRGEPFKIQVGEDGEEDAYVIEVGNTTENDIRRIRNLIATVDRVARLDYNIYNIVLEEANDFFSKQKTVQEVADLIQNRALIYINEQK